MNPDKTPIPDLAQVTPQDQKPAPLVDRYAASLLDGLIVGFAILPVLVVLILLGYDDDDWLPNLVTTVASMIYATNLTKKYLQTWGKKYFNLKVQMLDAQSMTWKRAIKREVLGKILSTIVFGIGYLWAIFNKKRQSWHDLIAGTMVVQTEPLTKGKKFIAYFLAFGLVVLAIVGVLAVVVLVSLNPSEQLSRSKDTGRIAAVTQIGHAVNSYYAENSIYPDEVNWASDLQSSGKITNLPSAISYSSGNSSCSANVENNTWCYASNNVDTIVFAKLESKSNISKCAKSENTYSLFSAKEGRGGIICSTEDPLPTGYYDFVQ